MILRADSRRDSLAYVVVYVVLVYVVVVRGGEREPVVVKNCGDLSRAGVADGHVGYRTVRR
jgi:hypothetical protein